MAEKVIAHVKGVAAPSSRSNITQDTEIYYDLGLYGDDFVFEIVSWIQREFGVVVDPPIEINAFVPGEGSFGLLYWNTAKRRARQWRQQRYRSLKVRDLVDAVVAGRWETN